MFVVYNVKTTVMAAHYKTASAARRLTIKLNETQPGVYDWTDEEQYNTRVVHDIQVRSLMGGELITIPSNTPWSCRPDSETYWSM